MDRRTINKDYFDQENYNLDVYDPDFDDYYMDNDFCCEDFNPDQG